MDDSTTIKKKKFGGIRRLGKFFGLGGSATKSETKSQIDDYEEFDLGTATNGIESIMALTPEQRALPVILLTEPDTKPISPVSVNSSSGFKPKSIPTSLNRAPGRVLSPRNRESEFIAKVPTQDLPSPVAAAPAVVAPAPAQRVEDIIRLKIPLHRRNSKSTSSGSEERTETIATASPVAVNVRSPISANDQVRLLLLPLLTKFLPSHFKSTENSHPNFLERERRPRSIDGTVISDHTRTPGIKISL
jgi:hypothetical protein